MTTSVDKVIEVEGEQYLHIEFAMEKIYTLSTLSAGAAVMSTLAALADFVMESVVETQETDIPGLIEFLQQRSQDDEFVMRFAHLAVRNTLAAVVEGDFDGEV